MNKIKQTGRVSFHISVMGAVAAYLFTGSAALAQASQAAGQSKNDASLEQISAPSPATSSAKPVKADKPAPATEGSEKSETLTKEKLESMAKTIEHNTASQNQPDYSLVVYPQVNWKEPPASQPGWQSYYLRVRFLLKGGLSHRMSDVSALPIDSFEAAQAGDKGERDNVSLQALNAIFTDEGTTGKAHATQNGLTNVFLTSEGGIHVKRSSLCIYDMPLAHHSVTKEMIKLIYLPQVKLPERCGDVPIGMELDIVSGPHEELLQKLYCDDFPKASYCSPNAEHWTISEFKQPS